MNIVSFSLFVPYSGIPHAGGELYRRHLVALAALGHEVTIIAPSTELNRDAARRTEHPDRVLLIEPRTGRAIRVRDRAGRLIAPHWLEPSRRSAFLRSAVVASLTERADLVEAHWSEMAFALDSVPTTTPTILYAHDIPLQREVRGLQSALRQRALKKTLWRAWRSGSAAATQRRSSDAADVLVTLSEKDARIAGRSRRRSATVWVDPPLWDSERVPTPRRRGDRPSALFVAAFNRRENVEAAVWLLSEVWPRVVKDLPEASLVIAGAHPPSVLHELAGPLPGVTVTGFVEDLEPLYQEAALAVIPVRSGAGVKFKTIEALVRGLPVVSTTVGAEGVTDERGRHPFTVTDDPDRFARAVVEILAGRVARDPGVGAAAREKYGTARYLTRLNELLAAARAVR